MEIRAKLFNTVKNVVSLVVLTNHGASAGRNDKVVRWGKVANVSEGEFSLRSRLAS